MKKITLLAIAAVAISFASCKKARTCTCTTTSSYSETHTDGTPSFSGSGGSGGYVNVSTTKLSKKQGKAWCASGKDVHTEVIATSADTETDMTTSESTCTLK